MNHICTQFPEKERFHGKAIYLKSTYAESLPISWTLARRMAHQLALAGRAIASGAYRTTLWTILSLLALLVTWPALIYLAVRALIGT